MTGCNKTSASSSISSVSSNEETSSSINSSSSSNSVESSVSSNENSNVSSSSSTSSASSSASSSSSSSSASSSLSSNKSSSASSSSSSSSSSSNISSIAIPKMDVVINNLSGDVCSIENHVKEALAGDKGSFTVTPKAEYLVESVSATNSKNRNVKLTNEGNDTYSYLIPTDGIISVTVTVVKKTVYQNMYIVDDKNLLRSAPQAFENGSWITLSDYNLTDDGYKYYSIPENAKIRFSLPNPDYYESLGIAFNGEEYTPDNTGTVVFDFTGISGNLILRTFGVKLMQDLHAVNSEHLTITFYSDSKMSEQITQIGIDENFYVKVTSSDFSIYVLKDISYQYTITTSDILHKATITDLANEAEDFYWFRHSSPTSPINEDGIIYTVTEDNLNKYIDEPFLGKYLGVQLFTYKNYSFTEFSTNKLMIIGSGKTTYSGKQNMIQKVYMDDDGVKHLSDREEGIGNELYYKNNIMLFSNNGTNTISTLFSHPMNSLGDDVVAFQMLPDTKEDDYSVYGVSFEIENRVYSVVTCYLNGEYYRGAMLCKGAESYKTFYYMDIQIEMLYGEHVTDDKAIYKVYFDDEQVLFVGFKGKGGRENRILPSNEKSGLYRNNSNEQLVICDNNAIYNDELYKCSINENLVRITSAAKDYNLVIDPTNHTFNITSSEIRNVVIGPFAGQEFRLRWYPNGINHEYGYYIKFAQDEATMSCVCDILWDMTMSYTSNSSFGKTYDAVYIYDPATSNFTAQIFGWQNELVTVTFHYSNNQISFEADQLSGGRGIFTTGVAVLDLVQ